MKFMNLIDLKMKLTSAMYKSHVRLNNQLISKAEWMGKTDMYNTVYNETMNVMNSEMQ